jgi:hypothetical protein
MAFAIIGLNESTYNHARLFLLLCFTLRMTMAQRFGGKPIPGQEIMYIKNMGIDLGSKYSSDLGFDGIEVFIDEMVVVSSSTTMTTVAVSGGGGKKKKKKRKKKGKSIDSSGDGEDGDEDDDDGGGDGGPEEIN